MKGRGLGIIFGVLIGLALRFALLSKQDAMVTVGIVFFAAFIGYLVDMLVYIQTDYQTDRRLDEVTRR